MIITNVRAGPGRPVLAWFDLEIEPGIRIYNVALKQNLAGDFRIYAPNVGDKRIVTFDVAVSDQIIEQALSAARSRTADGINTTAA